MSNPLRNKIDQGKGTLVDIEGRYTSLSSTRNNYLDRGQAYSRMTLPYILPEVQPRSGDANQHGFSGIGAQAVNHLANKLVMSMFPPQSSFFKLEFTEEAKATLKEAGYDPTQLAELLVSAEKKARLYQERIASRVALVEVMKHLIISGNVLLQVMPNGKPLRAIPLDRYVINRTLDGVMLELITMQEKEFMAFPETVKEALRIAKKAPQNPNEQVKLYTYVYRSDDDEETYYVAQSCNGVLLRDKQSVKRDDLPWIPLRWNSAYGEDYGRGLCEDHAGDLYTIEFLSEAIAKGMVLMSDVKYLVRPGSVTDIDELSRSPTGEYIFGNIDDIGVLQLEKYADFKPINEVLNEYKRRIGQAFMLNSAVRRDAERVTTYELRLDAQELETSLGGVYSLLAQTLQRPFAWLLLRRVGFPVPEEMVLPSILTGLEALGRVGDLDKIAQFTEMLQLPQTWPQQVQARTKFDVYAREVAASLSMEINWMMSDEEFQQAQQAQAQAMQQQQLMQEASKAAPDVVKQQINQGDQER